MINRALIAILTLGITLGSGIPPASAHRDGAIGFFACAYKRQHAGHVIDHSHFRWTNGIATIFSCASHDIDDKCGYDVVVWWQDHQPRVITGPYNVQCRSLPF